MSNAVELSHSVNVLGPFELWYEGEEQSSKLSRKTLALLGYLCITRRPHRRRALAELFCQAADDPMGTLRWHLSRIRKVLGADFLLTERDSVSLALDPTCVDLSHFEKRLQSDGSDEEGSDLASTLSLYRGELLAEIALGDAGDFELWLLGERNRVKMLYEQGLVAILDQLIQQQRHHEAIEYAQQLLRSDPLREETHSTLMWLYALNGQKEAARKQFQRCKEILQEELGIEPLEETQQLYQQVVEGDFSPTFEAMFSQPTTLPSASTPTAPSQKSAPFVGRHAQMQSCSQLWQEHQKGNAKFLLIEADAGGGKTRFVEELASAHADVKLLRGRCYLSEQAFPYHPWVGLLEECIGALDDAKRALLPLSAWEQIARLLPELAYTWDLSVQAPAPTSGGDLEHFCAAIRLFFSRMFEGKPVWIWFDDFHWIDEASLRLLQSFLRHSRKEPLFFLGTRSPQEMANHTALQHWLDDLQRTQKLEILSLPSLERDEISTLLDFYWPSLSPTIREDWTSQLFQVTQGNPQHLHEIFQDSNLNAEAPDKALLEASLQQIIERKLAQLSTVTRQIFEAMAVFGMHFRFSQVQQICGRSEEEVVSALETGMNMRLLCETSEEATFGFLHTAIRKAILSQLSMLRSQLLHRRAAVALEQTGGQPATLVYHWERAQVAEKVVHYAMLAGMRAVRCFAHEESIQFLKTALQWAESPIVQASILRRLGEVYHWMGDAELAQESLHDALQRASSTGQAEEIGECAAAYGRFLLAQGEPDAALKQFAQAHTQFQAIEDLYKQAQIFGEMGRAHRMQGQFAQAQAQYEAKMQCAQQLAEPLSSAVGFRLRSEALGAMAMIYTQQGLFDKAQECFAQMLALSKEDQRREEEEWSRPTQDGQLTLSQIAIGTGALTDDSYTRTLQIFESQLDEATRHEDPAQRHHELGQLSAVAAWMGDYPRAYQFVLQHFELAFQQQSLSGLSKVVGNLAELCRASGELQKAEQCYLYRLALCLDLGERRGVATSLGRLAEIMIDTDRLHLAQTPLQWAIQICRACGFLADLCRLVRNQTAFYTLSSLWSDAIEPLEELLSLSQSLKLRGLYFEARLLHQHVFCQINGHVTHDDIVRLEQMLPEAQTAHERALLYYALHQVASQGGMSSEAKAYAAHAATHFRESYQRYPSIRHAMLYQHLTGQALPAPAPLADLPTILQQFQRPIAKQQKKIQRLLDELLQ